MASEDKILNTPESKHKWTNPVSGKKVGRSMHTILDGSFLTRRTFVRGLPFILFLMFLGILYITNIFRVERTKRQLDNLEEDLRELRYEYISSRSKLMYESKPSEVSAKLAETGIRETLTPPTKIQVSEKPNQDSHAGY